jgi:phosphoglycolate phosphatase
MNTKLLICDLDNTLYDWVHYFVSSFYAMVDSVCAVTGCDRNVLLDDFRAVHQLHGDSEYPFSLLETDTVRQLFPHRSRAEAAEKLDAAFHAFNTARKSTLQLYPGVREGLDGLEAAGISLVAHTESNLLAVVDRLSRLDLTRYFSRIYCRERASSEHPKIEVGQRWLDSFPMHKVRELSHHQRKPNPDVLLEICADEGANVGETAYVGDSLARDIAMAKKVGAFAVWAKYGSSHAVGEYEKLVRITHWTRQDVERELLLKRESKALVPDYVLESSFLEVLPAVGVQPITKVEVS